MWLDGQPGAGVEAGIRKMSIAPGCTGHFPSTWPDFKWAFTPPRDGHAISRDAGGCPWLPLTIIQYPIYHLPLHLSRWPRSIFQPHQHPLILLGPLHRPKDDLRGGTAARHVAERVT